MDVPFYEMAMSHNFGTQRRLIVRKVEVCPTFKISPSVQLEKLLTKQENGQSSFDMSSLSIFPIEILESITGIVTTSQQMRLWLCGDRILNIKFKNGGLKRTSLCWSGWTWMPWPHRYFATFNGLVDVEWDVSIGRSLCPTLELNLLPKTLRRLHLACDDVFLLLHQQNINMNDMLPFLESLHLSGSRLREENLKNLPSDLIELHVASLDDWIRSRRIFGDLPRRIERLTLLFSIMDQSELENDLPSGLIWLDIYQVECNFDWHLKLPKSLKRLKVSNLMFRTKWSLPPQLEALHVLRLELLSAIPISGLPQTLKTLELPLQDDDGLGPLLPKNLTRLVLVGGRHLPSILQELPASLTDVDAIVAATHPDILSLYRKETINVRIEGRYSEQLNLVPFPTKLQYLKLEYINDDICAMLPLGLQKLKASGGVITIKGASKLPKSLTSLTAYIEMFNDNETMSYLRYISNLELKAMEEQFVGELNEHWISSLLTPPSHLLPTNANDIGSSSTASNVNLTSLIIRHRVYGFDNPCPYIQKSFFDTLPKFINLNALEICSIGDISSDWLCFVPKNVTNLKMSYLTAFPTAAQLSTLPICIRFLNLGILSYEGGTGEWTDETLQSLPRSLQEFRINGTLPNLTSRMYESLPPYLQRTSLFYKGESCSFATPLDRLYGKN